MRKFLVLAGAYLSAGILYFMWLQVDHAPGTDTTIEETWDIVAWLLLGPLNNLVIIEHFHEEFLVETAVIGILLYLACVHNWKDAWYGVGVVWILSAVQVGFYFSQMG